MTKETEQNVVTGHLDKKKLIWFLITALVTLIIWNLPSACFGIAGLTVVQQRVIAIFVMAVMLWITEAIPAWATSIAIIFVLLFCVSNSSFNFLQGNEGQYGQLLDSVGIMACFADPTIILFLGGFILAIAATKSGLDVWMAKTLIKPFGKKSENVLLGFLLITGVFSMFISNTATAAMMLTFLTPVFKALPANGKGRIALTMSIPIGANLGGMGTPIGTPPNAADRFRTVDDDHGTTGHRASLDRMGRVEEVLPLHAENDRVEYPRRHESQLAYCCCRYHFCHNHLVVDHGQVCRSELQHGGYASYCRLCHHGCHHGQRPAKDRLGRHLDGGWRIRPWTGTQWHGIGQGNTIRRMEPYCDPDHRRFGLLLPFQLHLQYGDGRSDDPYPYGGLRGYG